jgi:hypothetical protein
MNSPSKTFDSQTMTVHIPICLKRRGGRKLVVTPEGTVLPPAQAVRPPQFDAALTRALIRAWKWQKGLREGKYDSVEALAEQDKVSSSYVWLILRLNFLAPDLKQMILNGQQPKHWQLKDFLKPFPDIWEEQRTYFSCIFSEPS